MTTSTKVYCVTCQKTVESSDTAHQLHQISEDVPAESSRTLSTKVYCVTCQKTVESSDTAHQLHQVTDLHPNAIRDAAPMTRPASRTSASAIDPESLRVAAQAERQRYVSGVSGWDRCLGGGLVRGTTAFLSGDPGVGKSSLTLMVLYEYARNGIRSMIITGEETREEVEIRYAEMGLPITPNLVLYATKSWEAARAAIEQHKPSIILIDSANRISLASVRAEEGSDAMIAAVVGRTIETVQTCPWRPSAVLIAHINAKGEIRGEKGKIHDVTAQLHLSFDAANMRLLRSKKNRHGGSGEVSMWQFRGKRYVEVHDLSEALLKESIGELGVVAFPVLPSRSFARTVVVPIEASVSAPRESNVSRVRRVTGLRAELFEDVIDLLFESAGVTFANRSIRAKVPNVGGAMIEDDGCSLALCLSLVTSSERLRLPPIAAFGSLAPNGRVQTDPQAEVRIDALRRTVVRLAIGPTIAPDAKIPPEIQYVPIADLGELAAFARKHGTHVPEDPEVVARREATKKQKKDRDN